MTIFAINRHTSKYGDRLQSRDLNVTAFKLGLSFTNLIAMKLHNFGNLQTFLSILK